VITRYHTVFSIYEVDWDQKQIRRLEGERQPTLRQGEDGVWKTFESCSVEDYGLDITWSVEDGVRRATITSVIVWQENVHERSR
jgi:hypothetical protein